MATIPFIKTVSQAQARERGSEVTGIKKCMELFAEFFRFWLHSWDYFPL